MSGFDAQVPFNFDWSAKFTPTSVANPQFQASGSIGFTATKRMPGQPITVPPNGVVEVDFTKFGFTQSDFVIIQTITPGKPMGLKFNNSTDVLVFRPLPNDNQATFMGSANLQKVNIVNSDVSNPLDVIVLGVQFS